MNFGTDPVKLARADSPDTSKEAAASVKSARLEQQVYNVIKMYPNGCTSEQVRQHFVGYPYSSVTARFKALMTKGYIIDTGERKQSNYGRSMRVMRAA